MLLPYFLKISAWWDFISRPRLKRQQFEGGIYGDRHHLYAASISLSVCLYNACGHMYIVVDPLLHGDILRATFIGMSWLKYAVTFWGQWKFEGWWDFEVRRDFEEIWYFTCIYLNFWGKHWSWCIMWYYLLDILFCLVCRLLVTVLNRK